MYRHLFPWSPFSDFFEKTGGKLFFSSGRSGVTRSLTLTSGSSNTGFSRARPVHCLSLRVGAHSLVGPEIILYISFLSRTPAVPSWGPGAFWAECESLTVRFVLGSHWHPIIGFWSRNSVRDAFSFSCPKKAELVLSVRIWSSEPRRLEDLAENLWPLEPSAAPSPQYLVSKNRLQKALVNLPRQQDLAWSQSWPLSVTCIIRPIKQAQKTSSLNHCFPYRITRYGCHIHAGCPISVKILCLSIIT